MNRTELEPNELLARAVSALIDTPIPEQPLADALASTRQAMSTSIQAQVPASEPSIVNRVWRVAMGHKRLSFAASAAAFAAIVAGLLVSRLGSGVAFADVMKKMTGVQTLHLRITWKGKEGEAWLKRPNMMRINYTDGTYEISNGPTHWDVNENQNSAVEKPSFYYQHAQRRGLDVMDMLTQLHLTEGLSGFFSEKPLERVRKGDRLFDVYRTKVEQYGDTIAFEALADTETHLCHSMKLEQERDGILKTVIAFTVLEYDLPIPDETFLFQAKEGMRVNVVKPKPKAPEAPAAEGSTLSGRVVWASNGKPVPEARLTLAGKYEPRPEGGLQAKFFVRAETDREGRWRVTGVPQGRIRIGVRSWELDWPSEPTFPNNVGTLEQPRVIVDGQSDYTDLNFKVHKPGEFFARITINTVDEDGNPVEGASAHLWGDHGATSVYANTARHQQYTGPDGKVDATDVWPTEKPVRLALGHRSHYRIYAGWAANVPEPFVVERGNHYHFDIVLPKARTMKLQVVGLNGRPLQGVCVAVWANRGKSRIFPQGELVVTDHEGQATVTGLAPEKEVILALMRLSEGAKSHYDTKLASALVRLTLPRDRERVLRQVTFDDRPIRIEGTIASAPAHEKFGLVCATPERLGEMNYVWRTSAAETGDFVLQGVPAGELSLDYRYANKVDGRWHSQWRGCKGVLQTEPGYIYTVKFVEDRLVAVGKRRIAHPLPQENQE